MKMKQVCQLTGLTERTIRFYVEKELCAPETRWMDQRKYYDFSKENVEELRQAAELRKAYFSIQAIQTMRSSPERIPENLAGWTAFHGKKRKRRTRSTSGAGSGMKKSENLWSLESRA